MRNLLLPALVRMSTPCAAAIALLLSAGCASIITSGDARIPITSTPAGASITVYDASHMIVASGVTPTKLKLKKGAGYFKGAEYRLVIDKTGFEPREYEIRHDISGWYFGNFVLGGMLGLVVVDPLTGGMWMLKPDKIDAELAPAATQPSTALDGRQGGLTILSKDQLTPEQRSRLVPLADVGSPSSAVMRR